LAVVPPVSWLKLAYIAINAGIFTRFGLKFPWDTFFANRCTVLSLVLTNVAIQRIKLVAAGAVFSRFAIVLRYIICSIHGFWDSERARVKPRENRLARIHRNGFFERVIGPLFTGDA
jgi:hypothetical protein